MDAQMSDHDSHVETLTAQEVAEMMNMHSEGKNDIGIDGLGRIKSVRRNDAEAGVSLHKRRAWYEAA